MQKGKKKRKIRVYKATDADYEKAMRVAKKKKEFLATEIEKFVHEYGNDLYELSSK